MGAFTSALAIGMTAYGMVKQGQDAQAAANYNAQVSEQEAQKTEFEKQVANMQYDRALEKLEGQITVGVAAQNRDFSGSALYVFSDAVEQLEIDRVIEVWNLDVEKGMELSQARESRLQGQRERSSANVGAFTTLLTQGNSWYGKYG